MYQKGYSILIGEGKERIQQLPKWDFGGDKPWTNSIWNKIVISLQDLDQTNYPLIVSDLDIPDGKTITLENRAELDDWIKSFSTYE